MSRKTRSAIWLGREFIYCLCFLVASPCVSDDDLAKMTITTLPSIWKVMPGNGVLMSCSLSHQSNPISFPRAKSGSPIRVKFLVLNF